MRPDVSVIIDKVGVSVSESLGATASAVLYGSAARGEHLDDYSDINVLLVTQSLEPLVLQRLRAAIEPLRAHSRVPPLIFTFDEWRRSADVFPIEIVDMQVARRILAGADPLERMVVAPADLRRALEREFRGKLLRLRQAYALLDDQPALLAETVVRSLSVLGVLFRATLVLADGGAPIATPETIERAATVIGFDAEPVLSIYQERGINRPAVGRSTTEQYLMAVDRAVQFIDQFHLGGTP
ncbi:MAG: hypothetical protein KF785_11425 [Gemmatimonadales bacterium]|nr:hypothetical protein [Gemmatimonadales bacterium]